MPNGEMQLIAYGAQDIYLTGNPSITFFKFMYQRHTNFATEYIRQDFETIPNFNTENRTKAKCKINRNGDLISDIYLVYDLPDIYSGPKMKISHETGALSFANDDENADYFRWINNLGENIINTVELLVDGHLIDSQYGIWMNIWNELTIDKSKRKSYDMMIGNNSMLTNPSLYNGPYKGKSSLSSNNEDVNNKPTINAYRLYIPLPFWFCYNPGLAIPLIALQYNELYVYIEFNQLNDLFTVGNPAVSPEAIFNQDYLNEYGANYETNTSGTKPNNLNLSTELASNGYSKSNLLYKYINGTKDNNSSWKQNCYLDVNYIFLDKEERRKFASISHEYLITQVQSNHFLLNNNTSESISGSKNTLNLLFNHPVKEFIWVIRRTDVDKRNQWNNYTISTYDYDLYDNKNNYLQNYNKSVVSSQNLTDIDSYHPIKIFDILNYSQGKNSGFSDSTNPKNSSINPYYDINDFTNRNSDCFNNIENIMYSAKLIFNGNDRFSLKDNHFFNYLQPYKYHTNTPSSGVNVYSFALNPEESQPSGTVNTSRLNSLQLEINTRSINSSNTYDFGYEIFVFALNINVLRIMGGIGGLVFSN